MGTVCHESSCSALYHLELVDVFLEVRVPYTRAVLKLGTNKRGIGLLFYVLGRVTEVSPQESQHAVCCSTDVAYVFAPFEFVCDGDSKVFRGTNACDDLVAHFVREGQSVFRFVGDGEDITFLDVEFHSPGLGPLKTTY